jgi:hypothetical protein
MRNTRRKTICWVLRWAAKLLLILCCALGQAQEQQNLPDAPRIAKALTTDSAVGLTLSSMSTEPLTTSTADRLTPTLTEPKCGEEQSVPSSPNVSCIAEHDPFQLFLNSSAPHPMTPDQKALLAGKAVIDPFNLLTIGGLSAVSIAANADSPYGPGVKGWARLSGVLLTQDMTDEFVGTFLIPSLVHQKPRYHRMPNASYKRRIGHCIYQVIWTQSDDGKGMFNYSTVVGSAIDESISDAYVPYSRTGWTAASARYGVGLASDPIGNFITEFVPDLARRVNVHSVFGQRGIDQIAREEGAGPH